MSKRKPSKLTIPADLEAEADAALAQQRAQFQRACDEAILHQRCQEAVSSFFRAEESLWQAEHTRPCSCLKSFHKRLLAGCASLKDAGRLGAWEEIDRYALYREYADELRSKSDATFRWALVLFDAACCGELSEDTLIETADRESLRLAFRWLRRFVAELWGEGAFLNRQRQLVLPKPAGAAHGASSSGEYREGTKFKEEDVPPEFREGGKPDGAVLTTTYLEDVDGDWNLLGPYLTRNYGPGRILTTHIKVGRVKAYLFDELCVLRTIKTANEAKREAQTEKKVGKLFLVAGKPKFF